MWNLKYSNVYYLKLLSEEIEENVRYLAEERFH